MKTQAISLPGITCILLAFTLIWSGCSEEEPAPTADTTIQKVFQDVAPESFLQGLKDCGIALEEGNDPPTAIINKFFETTNIDSCNNIPEAEGTNFRDEQCFFSNFDSESFTLDVECRDNRGVKVNSVKAYLLGDGNNFTIYMSNIRTNPNGNSARFANVYSGTWNEETNTIDNFRWALLSVEIIAGTSGVEWLAEGKFRSFNAVNSLATDAWGTEYEQ